MQLQYHKFNYKLFLICDNQSEDKHCLKGTTRHTHFCTYQFHTKNECRSLFNEQLYAAAGTLSMSFMLLRTIAVESKRKRVANELGSADISRNLKGANR